MEPIITDALFFVVTTLIYALAFRLSSRENYGTSLLLLVLGGVLLRVYCSADLYLHVWDERYHALAAKNLLAHPLKPTLYEHPLLPYDVSNWTSNHIWLHKPPLTLWVIALSLKLFGINEFAVRVPSIILSTVAIKLMYDVAMFLFNKRIAFIAAFLCSVNGLLVEITSGRIATDHVDVFFMFFVLLCVWSYVKYLSQGKSLYIIVSGVALSAALLSKWLPALICVPVVLVLQYFYMGHSLRKTVLNLLSLLLIAIVLVSPWHIYIQNTFPLEAGMEYLLNMRHITEQLDGHKTNAFFHFDMLRINYGELVYLPVLWFTWLCFNTGDKRYWAISIWFWVVYLFFSYVATRMQAYTLFAAPAVFIITAVAFDHVIKYAKHAKYKRLVYLVAILFLALPVRHSLERTKLFTGREREPEWVKEMKGWSYPDNTVVFNYPNNIEAMFYHNLIVYPHVPEESVLSKLVSKGYNVVVYNN